MIGVPAVSSRELASALQRAGFIPARNSGKGSHQTWRRPEEGGRTRVVVIVLGRREVPRGTLRAILRQVDLTVDQLIDALR